MLRTIIPPLVAVALSVALPGRAHAWLRPAYEDAQVVDRSELIVVAHLKPDSIQYVVLPGHSGGWEHHAVLVITQTLKGKADAKEIPLVIHYGLDPAIGAKMIKDNFVVAWLGDVPKDSIQILDTGNSSLDMDPVASDAGKDNLWFLCKRTGLYGRELGKGDFGITDPEEVQPLALKDYFLCYLDSHPGEAVKAYLTGHPDLKRPSATRYVDDHLEIQRIVQIKDPAPRVEKLMPFFLRRTTWGNLNEADDALIAAGPDAAGPPLLKLFNDPAHRDLRDTILALWGRMRFAGCVDTLVEILRADDEFWAAQKLEAGWWNKDEESALTRDRRNRFGEDYHSVWALGRIADPRAKAAIQLTLRRWQAIKFENTQIVKGCTDALDDIDKSK